MYQLWEDTTLDFALASRGSTDLYITLLSARTRYIYTCKYNRRRRLRSSRGWSRRETLRTYIQLSCIRFERVTTSGWWNLPCAEIDDETGLCGIDESPLLVLWRLKYIWKQEPRPIFIRLLQWLIKKGQVVCSTFVSIRENDIKCVFIKKFSNVFKVLLPISKKVWKRFQSLMRLRKANAFILFLFIRIYLLIRRFEKHYILLHFFCYIIAVTHNNIYFMKLFYPIITIINTTADIALLFFSTIINLTSRWSYWWINRFCFSYLIWLINSAT